MIFMIRSAHMPRIASSSRVPAHRCFYLMIIRYWFMSFRYLNVTLSVQWVMMILMFSPRKRDVFVINWIWWLKVWTLWPNRDEPGRQNKTFHRRNWSTDLNRNDLIHFIEFLLDSLLIWSFSVWTFLLFLH